MSRLSITDSRFPIRALQLLFLSAVAFAFSGCGGSGAKGPSGVVVIVMDAARAENFGCYGYRRPTSPNIDEFARETTFYTHAIASSPWTLPTHASIFTGKDPLEHGAHRVDSLKFNDSEFANPLHEKHKTLAEAFEAKGFATGAFIANEAYVNHRYQMDQGFQTFRSYYTTSDTINDMVYQWLDTLSTDRFFLFINYMDTHAPYNARPRPGFLAEPPPNDEGNLHQQLLLTFMNPHMKSYGLSLPELQQTVIDQYDTAIANLDEQIGLLFEYLKAKGLYRRSIIVLTSDHGEAFGEHDLVGHGQDVYQQLLWVPLFIKYPEQTNPKRIETPVSTSDIPRIIFSQFPLVSMQADPSDFPNIPGEHPITAENYFAHPRILKMNPRERNFDRIRTVIFDWPYKYIRSSDGNHEIYDLSGDTRETANLFSKRRDIAERMEKRLSEYQSSRPRFGEITKQDRLTEEEIDRLKSLGYIGE